LQRVDTRIRHSPAVRVVTSPRLMGRTAIGLAQQLREWAAMGNARQPQLVESAAAVEARLHAYHSLRILWHTIGRGDAVPAHAIAAVAYSLGIQTGWLADSLAQQAFGALVEQVERQQTVTGRWAERWPTAEIIGAVFALRVRLADLRRVAVRSTAREEIEAVAVAALTADVSQLWLRPRNECLMHGIAGEGIVEDKRRPMNEQQMAAG